MTVVDLDSLVVGQMAWSSIHGADDTAVKGGMVVDLGIDEQRGPYVVVLDERTKLWVYARWDQNRQYTTYRTARLQRIYVDELGSVDPVDELSAAQLGARMHAWARKAMLTAALGETGKGRYVGQRDRDLITAALRLCDESGLRG